VKREAGVPDRETGGNRWSLDHLFIDQKAGPTLVERSPVRYCRKRRGRQDERPFVFTSDRGDQKWPGVSGKPERPCYRSALADVEHAARLTRIANTSPTIGPPSRLSCASLALSLARAAELGDTQIRAAPLRSAAWRCPRRAMA
jgi:hypothetical protein